MKKLSLKMKGIGEMLTREQMKKVLGGEGYEGGGSGSNCLFRCNPDSPDGVAVVSCSAVPACDNVNKTCVCV